INKPQTILNRKLGFNAPLDVMEPSTNAAESADVIKNNPMTKTANKLEMRGSGNCSNMANNVSSTSLVASYAKGKIPCSSIFNAVPPKIENHTIARTAGTTNTPIINSRIVLPFEIRAINNPTNGDQDICQAQKKIVFAPSHSFDSKGLIVRDMGTIFER